jgi:hypothetical protein
VHSPTTSRFLYTQSAVVSSTDHPAATQHLLSPMYVLCIVQEVKQLHASQQVPI